MQLEQPSMENMEYMLQELAEKLQVVNRSIMDAEDYNIDKYEDLKWMYDMVMSKGRLSTSETQAFINELAAIRK
ncbi:DUF1128 domain-containing protein [Oceanobacillus sojae]|uniref:DUF1128 domain-containing protein n=1 Tax=Oceanobacillus sojae TaxID=582851 RepID=UPI0009885582|nr:DUF1128 domain-containing protein [Oceanobacillus sojae]MCT1904169.1 DUF1128 domain-containing protein [Oceanobacillus sojae]